MKITAFLLILSVVLLMPLRFLQAEDIPESKLMYTGIDDSALEKEAQSLGIPADHNVEYVTGMKDLNKAYQDGDLTWSEYIMQKRNLIENLR